MFSYGTVSGKHRVFHESPQNPNLLLALHLPCSSPLHIITKPGWRSEEFGSVIMGCFFVFVRKFWWVGLTIVYLQMIELGLINHWTKKLPPHFVAIINEPLAIPLSCAHAMHICKHLLYCWESHQSDKSLYIVCPRSPVREPISFHFGFWWLHPTQSIPDS